MKEVVQDEGNQEFIIHSVNKMSKIGNQRTEMSTVTRW